MVSQGQQQTVMFCGDGLNDLAALGTAEVGMAIGPIDAMAAAPFSTKRSSIAGCPIKQMPTSSGQSLLLLLNISIRKSSNANLVGICCSCHANWCKYNSKVAVTEQIACAELVSALRRMRCQANACHVAAHTAAVTNAPYVDLHKMKDNRLLSQPAQ